MLLHVEVDEKQFQEILDKELANIPGEELQAIILDAFRNYLTGEVNDSIKTNIKSNYDTSNFTNNAGYKIRSRDTILNSLLISKNTTYGGYTEVGPSDLLKETLKNCDYSKLQDIVDKMIEDLEKNYHHILVDVLSTQLVAGICESYEFKNRVERVVHDMMRKSNDCNPYQY